MNNRKKLYSDYLNGSKNLSIGISLSVVYFILVMIVLFFKFLPFSDIYFSKYNISLGEIGGYLAGAFSPLVFLWLIVGHASERKKSQVTMKFILEERLNKLISDLPDFYFSDIAFNYKNEIYKTKGEDKIALEDTLHISIKNIGNNATRVRFFINDKNDPKNKDYCDYEIIEFNKGNIFNFSISSNKKTSLFKEEVMKERKIPKGQEIVHIQFRDASNTGRNVTYRINVEDSLDELDRHRVEIRTTIPAILPREM
ncbi:MULTISPECIES: hypothetical protein [Marinomonas]|uniref:Uncharacterized protein n=1 Tax=Marinomonas arctica TaxID=383750 RepID=A0A7H1J7Y7_9GAMM|nr:MULTISPECIES: hypothetical protein [Marinomonas]MCS7486748.1 hypothetical protein [Marinomonas sp. BSi20414]QNT06603.1 hypothetical protein IBG28_02790 [Marinomonas arctica]GGN22174.1 hypothetical protein GCM10011350_09740 [Marinomonas arctica]